MRKNTIPALVLATALLVYLWTGITTLTDFITADEHFWLPNYGSERIQEYWRAVAEGDWEDTRINDKPGVTLAYMPGFVLPLVGDLIARQVTVSPDEIYRVFDPAITTRINFAFRLPLFVFNGLLIMYLYRLLRRLTGDARFAALAGAGMLLSPVLLGMSQIVNPDTLFWTFGTATILSFAAYVRFGTRRDVWTTAGLFGLTLASKYVGLILMPFFLVMIAIGELVRHEATATEQPPATAARILAAMRAYWTVILGAIAVFALLMPALLVDTETLYASTIGFHGMLPVVLVAVATTAALAADALLTQSAGLRAVVRVMGPRLHLVERAVYGVVLAAVLFALFNWLLRNSLVDLTDIPFDAKTKASFTTGNPFLVRFAVEFVPLVFALTPVTLLLLVAALVQGVCGTIRDRALSLMLVAFVPVFYLAVVAQGLLVTVRYSILLFPIVLILGAGVLTHRGGWNHAARLLSSGLAATFLLAIGVTLLHAQQDTTGQVAMEAFVGQNKVLVSIGMLLVLSVGTWLLTAAARRVPWGRVPYLALAGIFVAASCVSLYLARPHFFIYTSSLLPDRYILWHGWGYGGYEAAQYLNAKPDARNLVIWTDAHGVCEFFVGKCIHRSKLDTTIYRPAYIVRTLRGQLSPKFPVATGSSEWSYAIGGRKKNFIRIYRNTYDYDAPAQQQ